MSSVSVVRCSVASSECVRPTKNKTTERSSESPARFRDIGDRIAIRTDASRLCVGGKEDEIRRATSDD